MFFYVISIKYHNTNVMNQTKNPIKYCRIKHIDVRYYFTYDYMLHVDIVFEFVGTNNQLVIFAKPLSEKSFNFIKKELEMLDGFEC